MQNNASLSSHALTRVASDVYAATCDLFMPGRIHFPCRMTVVKTPKGLVLISPIAIDDALAAALDALGPVAAIVAPNCLHYLWFAQAAARYPEAETWGAPGLAEKCPDVPLAHTLPRSDADVQPFFAHSMALTFVQGLPWANETVFFHGASKTLIATDLFFHIQKPKNWRSWLMFKLLGVLGRPKQSPLLRMQIKDKAAAAHSVRPLLALDVERLVVAHGPVVDTDARATLARVLQPMLRMAPQARLTAG